MSHQRSSQYVEDRIFVRRKHNTAELSSRIRQRGSGVPGTTRADRTDFISEDVGEV